MARLTGLFHPLLGQTIVCFARVTLIQDIEQSQDKSPLLDILLITLNEEAVFELLVEQEAIRFEKLPTPESLFASFDLEPHEKLAIDPAATIPILPQSVTSVTEIWAGEASTQFLVAVQLWNERKQHIISICTEGDEIEIMDLDSIRQRLDEMLFSYGYLSQQLYSTQSPLSGSPLSAIVVPRSA